MTEYLGDGRIGEVIRRYINRLNRGNRCAGNRRMRSSNSAISLASVG